MIVSLLVVLLIFKVITLQADVMKNWMNRMTAQNIGISVTKYVMAELDLRSECAIPQ
jgi:hypothetical protein